MNKGVSGMIALQTDAMRHTHAVSRPGLTHYKLADIITSYDAVAFTKVMYK